MDSDPFIQDIRSRAQTVLEELSDTIGAIPEDFLGRPHGEWPMWKQLYHVLYWLDHWFIDPNAFGPAAFHDQAFLDSALTGKAVSKQQLEIYLNQIDDRIRNYLSGISATELQRVTTIRGRQRSRLDMILGQFCHVSHHVGYLAATFRGEAGRSIWDPGAKN